MIRHNDQPLSSVFIAAPAPAPGFEPLTILVHPACLILAAPTANALPAMQCGRIKISVPAPAEMTVAGTPVAG
ncbi:hypothetical protein [Planctomyces sp. SH-PL62]|uniref:hypothetical protein n=1 Tax=Planctomyces sp. SH-PL62 TaxID=1636152 RepID=UPI00078CC67A|nr:hypothetical protein [Planctomyces sp. SH-PL62]AMV40252.1 hypothetical protein VT85_22665 [Planctomyces sp. SH-PL62]